MATEKGIAVTIKGFIPIDPKDIKAHSAALAAVLEADEEGDLSKLPASFAIEDFRADPVTRRAKD